MQPVNREHGDASAPAVERNTEGQIVVERPPPGLARGSYAWSATGIALVGMSVIVIALALLWILRVKRRPR